MDICIDGVQRIVLHTARAAAFINSTETPRRLKTTARKCPIYELLSVSSFDAAPTRPIPLSKQYHFISFQSFIITDYQQPVGTPEALQARSPRG